MVNNIRINNFGTIKHADIDIAPLTVFTGVNNSGKSFVARLIHTFTSRNADDFHRDISKSFFNTPRYLDEDNKIIFTQLNHEISNYFKNNLNKNQDAFKIPIETFNDLIDNGILKYFSMIFEEKIMEDFEAKLDDLINFKEDFFEIVLNNLHFLKQNEIPLKFYSQTIELKNTLYSSEDDEAVTIELKNDDEFIYLMIKSTFKNQNDFDSIFSVIYSSIAHSILNNILLEKSYYIPAERSEIIIDKKILSRRIKNESELSKNQSEVLSDIINIDSNNKGHYYDLGCEFDEEFSGFLIDIKEKDFINDIIYINLDSGENVSSKILSASIHEMTLFSLYLKYILKEGDLLIIEEPEAHLHPKNQLILLKYIVKSIKRGLKVMLITHSEYICNQLNNLVRRNNIPSEKCLELNYTEEDILDFNDLNIYNFKKNSNNHYITKKLDIDETGF